MFLNKNIPYTQTTRNQFIIALLLGVFVSFIVIFLQPYGVGLNDFSYKNIYFIGYGVLTFLLYLLTFFGFNFYFRKTKSWKWLEELLFIFLFVSLLIILANFYTELIINKKPSRITFKHLIAWFQVLFVGFGIIIGIITVLLRKHFAEHELIENEPSLLNTNLVIDNKKKVQIRSILKKDKFELEFFKIVYVKSEDNYVFVYYLENEILCHRMLRSTLSQIYQQLPQLVKTHRSYLVNPIYIDSVLGNSQHAKLSLKNVDASIAVSKTYYHLLKQSIH